MIFIYHTDAGKKEIVFENDTFFHLFKSRRTEINEEISVANLSDQYLYRYKIIDIKKKKAKAILTNSIKNNKSEKQKLHIGWCIIDPKDIKNTLPFLNQLGVKKITFVYSDFAQKSYKLNLEKLQKILINSSQQCGRMDLMEMEILKSTEEYIRKYPESYVLNFNGQHEWKEFKKLENKSILIGPEGGFSEKEKKIFERNKILSFKTNLVLKSENAVAATACKILL